MPKTNVLKPFGRLLTAEDPTESVNDLNVAELRETVRVHRILALRGFATFKTTDEFIAYAQQWGRLMEWPFGKVLELVEHDDPKDSVFGNGFLPYHWDGMYVAHIPEFQMFHCLSAPVPADGGRTLFADTTLMLADAAPEEERLWQRATISYQIDKAEHYGGKAVSPVIVPSPRTGERTIRFNEPMPEGTLNRSSLSVSGIPENRHTELLEQLQASLRDSRHVYAHAWQPGDVVVTDNYTLLHTREPFRPHASRCLQRIHLLGDPPLENPALAE